MLQSPQVYFGPRPVIGLNRYALHANNSVLFEALIWISKLVKATRCGKIVVADQYKLFLYAPSRATRLLGVLPPSRQTLRRTSWTVGFPTSCEYFNSLRQAAFIYRIGLAATSRFPQPLSPAASVPAASVPSTCGHSRVSFQRFPQVGSDQCGHWLQPIRLRLRNRLD